MTGKDNNDLPPYEMPPYVGDGDVGYGSPPRATRFQKGQSGNPKGRPRRAKGRRRIVQKVLLEVHQVETSQGKKHERLIDLLLRRLQREIAEGNRRAMDDGPALLSRIGHGEKKRSAGFLIAGSGPRLTQEEWIEKYAMKPEDIKPYDPAESRDPYEHIFGKW